MATVIDISLLNSVSILIVFVLVFVGGWGLMLVVDPFKDKGKSFYGLIAFLLALVMIMNRKSVQVVMTATPWLMIVVLIAFFFIFFAKMFGADDGSILTEAGKNKGWVIFFVILILVFALGSSLGPDLLPATLPNQGSSVQITNGTYVNGTYVPASSTASGDFNTNVVLTLFHPKILGVIFLFLLGTLTIILLNLKPAS